MDGLYPIVRRVRRPLMPAEDGPRASVIGEVQPNPATGPGSAKTFVSAKLHETSVAEKSESKRPRKA